MLGLPYPNKNDPELEERMKHLAKSNKADSTEFLLDLCMKAVNQSIGRVIRHKDDYACVILADYRYNNQPVVQKLPAWIRPSLKQASQFIAALSDIKQFFQKWK